MINFLHLDGIDVERWLIRGRGRGQGFVEAA